MYINVALLDCRGRSGQLGCLDHHDLDHMQELFPDASCSVLEDALAATRTLEEAVAAVLKEDGKTLKSTACAYGDIFECINSCRNSYSYYEDSG